MIALFVKRRVTTIIFIAAMMLMGIIAAFNLNIEENPKIDFPLVAIRTVYPGATPDEVESQVIKKIEDAVSEISEIKKVNSRAFENFGLVLIEFNLGIETHIKFIEVKDKVDAILADLPDAAHKPVVEKFDPLAKPVVDLVVASDRHSLAEIRHYITETIEGRYSSLPGVAKVEVRGGHERQINIDLDPALMKKSFVTIDDVISAVRLRGLSIPGGSLNIKKGFIGVRFVGDYANIEDIKNTVIITPEGESIKIGDIALAYDGTKEQEIVTRHNGKEVVSLGILNVSDGNPVKIAQRVNERTAELSKMLPEGMSITIVNDNTTIITDETADTLYNIVLGIGLTIIILLLFTGNANVTVISAIVIPSSIISTLFVMDILEFSINQMTMLAFATSLGTLIANAIVIIERVTLHLDQGKTSEEAAIVGTQEVVVPILASVGTNLVVFSPIAFMGGIVGKFMLEFGITVVIATLFSVVASFSLTPMLCGALLKPSTGTSRKFFLARGVDWLLDQFLLGYRRIYDLIFRFPVPWLVIIIAAIIATFRLAGYLGSEFTPDYDKDRVIVEMTLPQGARVNWTEDRVAQVEQIALARPEVSDAFSVIGINGQENAFVVLKLKPKDQRKKADTEIIQDLIPLLAEIPSTEFMLTRGGTGGSAGPDIQINVTGENFDQMIQNAAKMQQIMEESGYFQAVNSTYKTPKSEVRFIPDQDKLTNYGASNAQIAQALRASVVGDDSNVFKDEGDEFPINIRLKRSYLLMPYDIGDITIKTRKGIVPINKLGELKFADSSPILFRRDKQRIITLSGYLVSSTAGQVQADLTKAFNKIEFEPGAGFAFVGAAENQAESQFELAKAFGLATLMTFMILAAILNSWIHPFTISSSIFNSFAGVFLAMFIGGYSINIASLLALVMLVGLVVNNEIILLDEALANISRGASIKDGLWEAMKDKYRVIWMTSLTIVISAVPQLTSIMDTKASMGAVIIGGNLASLVFVFILTPVVFLLMERFRQWLGRLRRA